MEDIFYEALYKVIIDRNENNYIKILNYLEDKNFDFSQLDILKKIMFLMFSKNLLKSYKITMIVTTKKYVYNLLQKKFIKGFIFSMNDNQSDNIIEFGNKINLILIIIIKMDNIEKKINKKSEWIHREEIINRIKYIVKFIPLKKLKDMDVKMVYLDDLLHMKYSELEKYFINMLKTIIKYLKIVKFYCDIYLTLLYNKDMNINLVFSKFSLKLIDK
jgi:hypothetical protein